MALQHVEKGKNILTGNNNMSKNKITNDEAWREIENNPRKKMKTFKKYYKKFEERDCTRHHFAICISSHLCNS